MEKRKQKIYWKLSAFLSLILLILWIIIIPSNGKLAPIADPDQLFNGYEQLIKQISMLPSWVFNRWFDIPGLFLIVFYIHNIPLKWKKLWNCSAKGRLSAVIYMLNIIISAAIGYVAILMGLIGVNLLIITGIAIFYFPILTSLCWLTQNIPLDWHKRLIKGLAKAYAWIMQK